jgi:hypothetical protein
MVNGAADLSGASGILATARSPGFNGPVSEVKPTSIVRISGYDVEVRTAVAMGYLRKTATGYEEVTKADQDTAEAAKAEAQKPETQPSGAADVNKMTVTPFEPEVQNTLDIISEGKPEAEWLPAFFDYVFKKDSPHSVNTVASRLGWSSAQAEAFVTVTEQAFLEQADAEIAKTGADPEAFFEWCKGHRAAEYNRAAVNHMTARSLDGYRELAQEYVRTVVPRPKRSGRQATRRCRTRPLANCL